MTATTIFVARDGKEFSTESDALAHEGILDRLAEHGFGTYRRTSGGQIHLTLAAGRSRSSLGTGWRAVREGWIRPLSMEKIAFVEGLVGGEG